VTTPPITLYTFTGSNACATVDLALDHAALPHERVDLLPGLHAAIVRLRGFGGQTVPAMQIGDRKILGSSPITHAIADLRPDLEMVPSEPAMREQVLEAERLGVRVQNALRRIMYVNARDDLGTVRALMAGTGYGRLPGPALGTVARTIRAAAARAHRARPERLDADLQTLASALDRFDELVEQGVLGTEKPTVADFQIAPNVSALTLSPDVAPLIKSRPAWRIAERLMPVYPVQTQMRLPADQVELLRR
jgi:glutathione S-transferase